MVGYLALTRSVIVQFYRPQPYASLAKRNGNGLLIHVRGVRLPDDAPDMICRSRIVGLVRSPAKGVWRKPPLVRIQPTAPGGRESMLLITRATVTI